MAVRIHPTPLLPGDYLPLVWGMPKAWLQAVGEEGEGRKGAVWDSGEERPGWLTSGTQDAWTCLWPSSASQLALSRRNQ